VSQRVAKVALLLSKRGSFGVRKRLFWSVKVALLKSESGSFEKRGCETLIFDISNPYFQTSTASSKEQKKEPQPCDCDSLEYRM
jgi:hypothetical protein